MVMYWKHLYRILSLPSRSFVLANQVHQSGTGFFLRMVPHFDWNGQFQHTPWSISNTNTYNPALIWPPQPAWVQSSCFFWWPCHMPCWHAEDVGRCLVSILCWSQQDTEIGLVCQSMRFWNGRERTACVIRPQRVEVAPLHRSEIPSQANNY